MVVHFKGREGPDEKEWVVRKMSIVVYWSQTVVMNVLLYFNFAAMLLGDGLQT